MVAGSCGTQGGSSRRGLSGGEGVAGNTEIVVDDKSFYERLLIPKRKRAASEYAAVLIKQVGRSVSLQHGSKAGKQAGSIGKSTGVCSRRPGFEKIPSFLACARVFSGASQGFKGA